MGIFSTIGSFFGGSSGQSIGGAGDAILDGFLSKEGSENANVASAEQAQRQMDFQERMSNTSYQRAVKDMSAAGLNPMLAYSHGGASSGAGAMGQVQNTLGAGVNSAQAGAVIGPQIAKVKAETEESESRTANNNVQTANIVAETKHRQSSAAQLDELVRYLKERNQDNIGRWEAEFAFDRHRRERIRREGEEAFQQGNDRRPTIDIAEAQSRIRSRAASALLDELEGDRGRAWSDFWKSGFGKAQPFIESGLKDVHSAAGAAASARFGGFRLPGAR